MTVTFDNHGLTTVKSQCNYKWESGNRDKKWETLTDNSTTCKGQLSTRQSLSQRRLGYCGSRTKRIRAQLVQKSERRINGRVQIEKKKKKYVSRFWWTSSLCPKPWGLKYNAFESKVHCFFVQIYMYVSRLPCFWIFQAISMKFAC